MSSSSSNALVETESGLVVPASAVAPSPAKQRRVAPRSEGQLLQRLARMVGGEKQFHGNSWTYALSMLCQVCKEAVELKREARTGEVVLECGCTMRLLEGTYVSKEGVL